MIYKTPYGDALIYVRNNDRVTVRLSGGADSAIMMCLIVDTCIAENKNIDIYPISAIKEGREHLLNNIKEIIAFTRLYRDNKLKENSNLSIVIHDTTSKNAANWLEKDTSLEAQVELREYFYKTKNVKHDFNGVTMNPSDTKFKELENELKSKRSFHRDNPEPSNIVCPGEGEIEGFKDLILDTVSVVHNFKQMFWEPFRNQDKRLPIFLYKKLKLENLLNKTRSCEGFGYETENFTKECGMCWWCIEKKWAYEKVYESEYQYITYETH